MSKLTDAVLALAGPVAAQQGCEIWDVEYVKEAGSRYLRVYIDKPDGVSIALFNLANTLCFQKILFFYQNL